MKAVMITFDQAHYEHIIDALDRLKCRGYTSWNQVNGRGSRDGDPHLGSHAWPSMNSAILTIVPDERVDALLARLREFDNEKPRLGLRAFTWTLDAAGI